MQPETGENRRDLQWGTLVEHQESASGNTFQGCASRFGFLHSSSVDARGRPNRAPAQKTTGPRLERGN